MKTHSEQVGRFSFDISYRRFNGDEGLSIKVEGPVESENKELLRFDCFLKTPHYHVGVYGKNEITSIEHTDAVEWSLEQLRDRFTDLVSAAGGESLNTEEQQHFSEAIGQVSDLSRKLVAQEQSASS